MISISRRWLVQTLRASNRNFGTSHQYLRKAISDQNNEKKHPAIHENGLYYGKFTEEEYQSAAKYVKTKLQKLENEIKGEKNIRENIEEYPIVPLPADRSRKVKVESLSDLLAEIIKTNGPLSLLAYMRQCLTHPDYGYYTTTNPLDKYTGDFITSPEISSVFGEMIGIWLFSTWTSQDNPQNIRIIEFGPGKGTLMFDVVRTFNKLAKSRIRSDQIEICLIEASPILRDEQAELLCGSKLNSADIKDSFYTKSSIWGNTVKWLETEKDILDDVQYANSKVTGTVIGRTWSIYSFNDLN